jgi:hypothetical protein
MFSCQPGKGRHGNLSAFFVFISHTPLIVDKKTARKKQPESISGFSSPNSPADGAGILILKEYGC